LEEVVLNLISNARDALAEQIQESAKHPRIKLQTFMDGHNSKNWVVIQVNDSGSGIPEEVLEKVFDPFFTTKDADQGTGLGLSISKKIIEEFSGKIEIQSKQGVGTTVNIYLPSVQPASKAKQ
jgi:signal transduction histidine kinase